MTNPATSRTVPCCYERHPSRSCTMHSEAYIFQVTEKDGLCRIRAVGKDIEMNSFGTRVRAAFDEMKDAVSDKYGKPEVLDFVANGSIWDEPEDFAMGLAKEERVLAASWTFEPARASYYMKSIVVSASATSMSNGYLGSHLRILEHRVVHEGSQTSAERRVLVPHRMPVCVPWRLRPPMLQTALVPGRRKPDGPYDNRARDTRPSYSRCRRAVHRPGHRLRRRRHRHGDT